MLSQFMSPSCTIPPISDDASNSTTSGLVVVDRQCGNTNAFLFFWNNCGRKSGFGSTSRPVH